MEPPKVIPDKLFFKIGEVCDLVDVQPHVLRYWESEFPMLAPQKNKAGQRVYRRKDVEIVVRIRELLYTEKFTIAGAKSKLAGELRAGSGARLKVVNSGFETEVREDAPMASADLASAPERAPAPAPPPGGLGAAGGSASQVGPHAKRSIKRIRRELEALLTMLEADAIKPDRR